MTTPMMPIRKTVTLDYTDWHSLLYVCDQMRLQMETLLEDMSPTDEMRPDVEENVQWLKTLLDTIQTTIALTPDEAAQIAAEDNRLEEFRPTSDTTRH